MVHRRNTYGYRPQGKVQSCPDLGVYMLDEDKEMEFETSADFELNIDYREVRRLHKDLKSQLEAAQEEARVIRRRVSQAEENAAEAAQLRQEELDSLRRQLDSAKAAAQSRHREQPAVPDARTELAALQADVKLLQQAALWAEQLADDQQLLRENTGDKVKLNGVPLNGHVELGPSTTFGSKRLELLQAEMESEQKQAAILSAQIQAEQSKSTQPRFDP